MDRFLFQYIVDSIRSMHYARLRLLFCLFSNEVVVGLKVIGMLESLLAVFMWKNSRYGVTLT